MAKISDALPRRIYAEPGRGIWPQGSVRNVDAPRQITS